MRGRSVVALAACASRDVLARQRARRTLLLAAFVCSAYVPLRALPAAAADRCATMQAALGGSATITVAGLARSYLVHAPLHAGRLPVVFAFHGRGETPELLAHYSGLSAMQALVVYPRGQPGRGGKLSWSGTPGAAAGVDDVRFVESVLDRLEATACVDPARVYATGKSDGGGLAAQLACMAAARFAAVAPVAGAYYPVAGGCRPARAVAVLEFHGTADRVVPYVGSARRRLPGVQAWLSDWARRDGCKTTRRGDDAAGVKHLRWTRCKDGASVEGYRIAGGGHTWPGALAPSGPGMTSRAVDATALIERFFAGRVREPAIRTATARR